MTPHREIGGIQYLRGFAALGVVVCHVAGMCALPGFFGQPGPNAVLQFGAVGVGLFFAISGFIICAISLEDGHLAPAITIAEFARRRFLRIVPLLWLTVIAFAALRALGGQGAMPWHSYVIAFFLWPLGHPEPTAVWTLRHEAIFYAVFALSLLGARRRPWILGLWLVSPFLFLLLPPNPHSQLLQLLWRVAHPVNIEFGAGLALGLLWLRQTRRVTLRLPSPVLLLAAMTLGLFALAWAWDVWAQDVRSTVICALLCLPILFVGIHAACPPGRLDRAARLLGAASFSIYLFHLHFASALLLAWARLGHGTPMLVVIPIVTLLSTLGGIAVHLWIEVPLVRLSRVAASRLMPQTLATA